MANPFRCPIALGNASVTLSAGLGAAVTVALAFHEHLGEYATPLALGFAVVGLAAFAVGQVATRKANQQVRMCTAVLKAAARGDFEERLVDIQGNGRLAELAWAVNESMDAADQFVREAEASLLEVSNARFYRRMVQRGMHGSYERSAAVINAMTHELETKIRENRNLAERFKSDMAQAIETGMDIARATHAHAERMESACGRAVEQSSTVLTEARQATTQIEEVANATDSMAIGLAEVRSQAVNANRLSTEAVRRLADNRSVFANLEDSARTIGRVVGLISTIARQTNLLALNASIESERAGEAGKGFAVVAKEVKGLANQTAQATAEIEQAVAAIQSITEDAVHAMEAIGDTVDNLSAISREVELAVSRQADETDTIARIATEVRVGMQRTASAMEVVDSVSRETAAIAQQLFENAQNVSRNAMNLTEGVEGFMAAAKGP